MSNNYITHTGSYVSAQDLDPTRFVVLTLDGATQMGYLFNLKAVVKVAVPGYGVRSLGRFDVADLLTWPEALRPCADEPTGEWEDAVHAILAVNADELDDPYPQNDETDDDLDDDYWDDENWFKHDIAWKPQWPGGVPARIYHFPARKQFPKAA